MRNELLSGDLENLQAFVDGTLAFLFEPGPLH
jgi:hypothetical protein